MSRRPWAACFTPGPIGTRFLAAPADAITDAFLAVMRWATDDLAGLQGQAVAKDRAPTTKRMFDDLLDDLRAGLGR